MRYTQTNRRSYGKPYTIPYVGRPPIVTQIKFPLQLEHIAETHTVRASHTQAPIVRTF